MTIQRFASVWDAIEDTPEEAENMKIRSMLMKALKERVEAQHLTQANAAKMFRVTQPRVSDLLRGKSNLFAIDALVNMAAASGLIVEVRVKKAAASQKREVTKARSKTAVKTASKVTAGAKAGGEQSRARAKAPSRRVAHAA
ncbi:XRE family transcriptional regulator [Aquincola sp. S2]|uniref:XRE family transcriptional regulator n=1 Tax=Pseudaquabacterium terrae TaxID=2732868 RepID=A0ABX2ETD2_9BURK|nr:XRE family transcriptional regulator [Aquabacterium terrae]